MSLHFDLHCHSSFSDGVLPPEELALRAKSHGVDVWALTDHDELNGLSDARRAAQKAGLDFITGVEISITWIGKTIHIVGLNFDENNPALVNGLATLRQGRKDRARMIDARLSDLGMHHTYEGALQYVANPELISRTHFARYLVDIGEGRDLNDIFSRFLAEGKPAYVPHQWATLEQAVSWITGAGGVAVVAHPGRYHLSDVQFDVFFNTFKELGGEAIEVVTGSHTPDQYAQYANVANQYGFMASMGSDFHSVKESRIDLGMLPDLPKKVVPVWKKWGYV